MWKCRVGCMKSPCNASALSSTDSSLEYNVKYTGHVAKLGKQHNPPGSFATFCCATKPTDVVWTPRSCNLYAWSAQRFCETLGNRTLLLVGDSTMEQLAVTLMNALHGTACAKRAQVSYGESDLLTAVRRTDAGRHERGRSLEWHITRRNPHLVLFGTGAHFFERMGERPDASYYNESYYSGSVKHALEVAQKALPGRVIWKTLSPGGCGARILDGHMSGEEDWYAQGYSPSSECASRSCWESRELGRISKFFPEDDGGGHLRSQFRHYPRMDAIAREHCKRAGVPVLDASPLYRRVDAHPGSSPALRNVTDIQRDCLHFCANPNGPLSLLLVLLHHVLLSMNAS